MSVLKRKIKKTKVCCRSCGWTGEVHLMSKRRNYLVRLTLGPFVPDDFMAASTGLPCKKCGKHHLRRITKIRKLALRKGAA